MLRSVAMAFSPLAFAVDERGVHREAVHPPRVGKPVLLAQGSKRPFGERRQRREDAPDAFGVHDERPHVILRVRVDFEIGHIVADPAPG